MNINSEDRLNVLRSAFTLARSLKRRPAETVHHFSPSVERSLMVIRENDGLTSRDLSEKLDIRPSSVTELVNRLITTGLVVRKEDEDDKRLSHICLTDLGKAEASFIEDRRKSAVDNFSSCFTDDEAAEFCRLADKLSAHLREKEAAEAGKCRKRRPEGCHRSPLGHDPRFDHGNRPGMHPRFRRMR